MYEACYSLRGARRGTQGRLNNESFETARGQGNSLLLEKQPSKQSTKAAPAQHWRQQQGIDFTSPCSLSTHSFRVIYFTP